MITRTMGMGGSGRMRKKEAAVSAREGRGGRSDSSVGNRADVEEECVADEGATDEDHVDSPVAGKTKPDRRAGSGRGDYFVMFLTTM